MSISSSRSAASSRYVKERKKVLDKTPKDDLLDMFHPPDQKICDIVATTTAEKVDPFHPFRPKTSKEYLDYNISQTVAKMDCGPTKIHVSQIRAEYEQYPEDFVFPEKPPKRRKRKQHGRGPVWLYLDEIYKRRVDREQDANLKLLEVRLGKKQVLTKHEKKRMVGKIVENALPNWFLEMSNRQMRGADDLEKAISKDLRQGTICNVQECITTLGLVLRPNHRNVRRAMNNCCKNPVVFLSLLYKYSRPKANEYTVNDRILLSAMVHLLCPIFLREMHVRVPSPPREEPEETPIVPCTRRRVKYASPYLVPYTFEPNLPKHTGVYKNRHVQYPDSPYFSYLQDYYYDMYLNQLSDESGLTHSGRRGSRLSQSIYKTTKEDESLERELDEERDCAQALYNKLFKGVRTSRLLRASVYERCVRERPEPQQPPATYQVGFVVSDNSDASASLPPSGAAEGPEKAEGSTEGEGATTDENADKTPTISIDKGELEGSDGMPPKKSSSSLLDKQETCEKETLKPHERYPMRPNVIPISGGITHDRDGHPVPIIAGLLVPDQYCKCNIERARGSSEESVHIFAKRRRVCRCQRRLEKEKQHREAIEKMRNEQKLWCTCEMCSCKDRIPSPPPSVASIPPFNPPSQDLYRKESGPKSIDIVEPPDFHCECKSFADRYLAQKQYVDECEKTCTRKKSRPAFVVTYITKDGKRVIGAAKAPKLCTCLERYKERIGKFEQQKRVERAQEALKSTRRTFVVAGVKIGPEGRPIFMLSGIAPEKRCFICAERHEEEKKEKQRIADMPIFPVGRVKYHISGVRKTPKGNVYIISGAASSEPCDCMQLYDKFVVRHSRCMKLYERYLQKVKTDTKQYLEELKECEHCDRCNKCYRCLDCEQGSSSSSSHKASTVTTWLDLPPTLDTVVPPAKPTIDLEGLDPTNLQASVEAEVESPATQTAASGADPTPTTTATAPLTAEFPPLPPPSLPQLTSTAPGFSTTTSSPPSTSTSCLPKSSSIELISSVACVCVKPVLPTKELTEETTEEQTGESTEEPTEEPIEESTTTTAEPPILMQKPAVAKPSTEAICKRYVLLKKLPWRREKQIAVLKKVLKGMAADGYPVINLPGAYKLPHFRLWMALRCGDYWTMDDRVGALSFSKKFWKELAKCTSRIPTEKLNMPPEMANAYTWAHSCYVKALTNGIKDKQYRIIKQSLIKDARDFFPSTFDYELPTKNFRDCYFAYMPSKEQAVFPRYPWSQFEYRNYNMMREKAKKRAGL